MVVVVLLVLVREVMLGGFIPVQGGYIWIAALHRETNVARDGDACLCSSDDCVSFDMVTRIHASRRTEWELSCLRIHKQSQGKDDPTLLLPLAMPSLIARKSFAQWGNVVASACQPHRLYTAGSVTLKTREYPHEIDETRPIDMKGQERKVEVGSF